MLKPDKSYATSKFHNSLIFPEPLPRTEYFQHQFDGYGLEGRIVYNELRQLPWLLSIHGARADFTKMNSVTAGLQTRGYSQLALNMSGHSAAGVLEPAATSLGANIREVEAFYDYLDDRRPKIVIGYSMGGTPALKLLERHSAEIEKLILFYPGIYDPHAYDIHFGSDFTYAISKPYSYRQSDTIGLLSEFKGKLLLVVGEYDGLDPVAYGRPAGRSAGQVEINGVSYYSPIPKEVIDILYEAVPETKRQKIIVPQCGHSVVLWMRDHPQEAESLLDSIDSFIRS